MNYSTKMAPNHLFMLNGLPLEPVSRTYQYRKIMKPMLERKRRARINRCLDELKDLMTGTLQADGENLSKLEKADILELTVRHLHRLREHNVLFVRQNETLNMEKFWAGFQHCAAEVSHFLSKYDQRSKHISGDLIKYIANYVPNMAAAVTAAANNNNQIMTNLNAGCVNAANRATTPAAAAMNLGEHYQRFCAELSKTSTEATAAASINNLASPVATVSGNAMETPTTTMNTTERRLRNTGPGLRIWAASQTRMHPYARKHASMSADTNNENTCSGSGDDSSAGSSECSDGTRAEDSVAGCLLPSDGIVWRPW